MATLEQRLIALTNAVGTAIKQQRVNTGDLTSLNTTTKSSVVAAINELYASLGAAGAQINDGVGAGASTVTWSADKIYTAIEAAKAAVAADLIANAPAALDTLKELSDALGADPNFATTLANSLNGRVRWDAVQTLTAPQQTQARENIGAADAVALATLTTNVGDTNVDLVATLNTAMA